MPTDPESRERIRQIQNEMALTVDNIEKKKKRYLQIQSRYKKQKERWVSAISDLLQFQTIVPIDTSTLILALHFMCANRLEVLEEELIDGRAELVATSGILEQNENIRNKIQVELKVNVSVVINTISHTYHCTRL